MPDSATRDPVYALRLRVVASAIAFGTVLAEVSGPRLGIPVAYPILGIRLAQVAAFVTAALLATSWRPVRQLHWLVWAVGLTLAVPNLILMAVWPPAVWEGLFWIGGMPLGVAIVALWSWRQQAAFVAVIWTALIVTILRFVPSDALAPWGVLRVGEATALVALVSVVTAQILGAERRQIATSRARYRRLFDGAGDAIVLLDSRGAIVEANARFERLLREPVAALIGRSLGDMLTIKARPEQRGPDLEGLVSGLPASGKVVRGQLTRVGGRRRDVEIALARIEGPPPTTLQAIIRDVTEQRALERRETRVKRMEAMSRFAGGIAHQFNNLLGGVLSQATLLKDDTRDPILIHRLEEMAGAAREGERLTKALVRFTPYTMMTAHAVDVRSLMDAVAQSAEHAADEGDAPLMVETEPKLPPIAADADHLTHALLELIENAREAMGFCEDPVRLTATAERVVAGDIRWHGTPPGRYVRFSVVDTGRGMDTETRAQLFEPFFTTKELEDGSGVGLASVDWVVLSHKGAIAVDSALNHGTTVHLIIPIATEASVTAEPAGTARATRDPAEVTVLVVDDETLIRNTAVRALDRFGYHTLAAADGDAGLAALRDAHPPVDLAILDVVMPGGGPTLVERMREVRPGLRILVSSGYGPSGEVEQMLAAGANGFLQKPYEIAALREAVARVLVGTGPAARTTE